MGEIDLITFNYELRNLHGTAFGDRDNGSTAIARYSPVKSYLHKTDEFLRRRWLLYNLHLNARLCTRYEEKHLHSV